MTETEIGTIVMLRCTPLRLSALSERSERARENAYVSRRDLSAPGGQPGAENSRNTAMGEWNGERGLL